MQNTTKTIGNKIPGFLEAQTYIELLQTFPPKPIHSEEELDQIQEIIDFFLDKPTRTGNEREYLHLLGLLVQDYEDQHYPIADASVGTILVNLMEEHQTSIDDLSTVFKSEQDFNALINGDRDITIKQMQTLAKIFQVSPTVFIENSLA